VITPLEVGSAPLAGDRRALGAVHVLG
jgi:hypothetical protein